MAALVSFSLMNKWLKGFAFREALLAQWPVFVLTPLAGLVIAFCTMALQSCEVKASKYFLCTSPSAAR